MRREGDFLGTPLERTEKWNFWDPFKDLFFKHLQIPGKFDTGIVKEWQFVQVWIKGFYIVIKINFQDGQISIH